MAGRFFTRARARRFSSAHSGFGNIVHKAFHKMVWYAKVKEPRHEKAILAMTVRSGLPKKAVEKAYVQRMIELDKNKKETGEYGSFDSPKVYADALNYESEFKPEDYQLPESNLGYTRLGSLDDLL